MSQHLFDSVYNDRPIRVMMGFDRPLNGFFMNIQYVESPPNPQSGEASVDPALDDEESEPDEGFIYDSLVGSGDDLSDYRSALQSLGIVVPESIFREVQKDADNSTGNRVTRHFADGRFEDILAADRARTEMAAEAIVSTEHDPAEILPIGPSDHVQGGYIRFQLYQSDEIGIEVINSAFEQLATATVALRHAGAPHPGPFGVWLKDWSGNEGLPEALVLAGLVKLTGITFALDFVTARHGELTARARDMYVRTRLDLHNRSIFLEAVAKMVQEGSISDDDGDFIISAVTAPLCTQLLRDGMAIPDIIDRHRYNEQSK